MWATLLCELYSSSHLTCEEFTISRRLLFTLLSIVLCLSGIEQNCNASFAGSPNPTIFNDGFETIPITEDDGDATILDDVGVEPTSIDSMQTTPFVVLDFRIVDGGFSDGRSTEITGLLLRQSGHADATKHAWSLAGDDINGSAAGVATGPIGNQTISFVFCKPADLRLCSLGSVKGWRIAPVSFCCRS